jgi:Uncharacterised nucleotidyltransferase
MIQTIPENELLVCIARKSLDHPRKIQLRALASQEVDWNCLLASAHWHGLIPLLYLHLKAICQDLVPAKFWTELQQDNQYNVRHSLFFTGELLNMMSLLNEHGVSAIAYKGPALAISAYGDVALRQFGDLDILVRKRDVLKVRKLLIARGCEPELLLTNAQEAALLKHYYEYPFMCNQNRVLVEVHWAITERYFAFDFDIDQLWTRPHAMTIGGRQVSSLSLEDSLLILCAHHSKHCWERIGWIGDIAGLINGREDVRWRTLLEDATKLGSRRMVMLGLFLANDLLEASIPEAILKMVQADPTVRYLGVELQSRLFLGPNVHRGLLETVRIHLQMRERMRDKLKYCFRLATTTTVNDWWLLSLPGWLFFLYYPLRPIRLFAKYGARLLRRSHNGKNPM